MENQTIDTMNTSSEQTPSASPVFTSEATPAQKKSGKLLLVLVVIVAIVLLGVALLGERFGVEETDETPLTQEQVVDQDLSSLEAELDATVFEGVSEGL